MTENAAAPGLEMPRNSEWYAFHRIRCAVSDGPCTPTRYRHTVMGCTHAKRSGSQELPCLLSEHCVLRLNVGGSAVKVSNEVGAIIWIAEALIVWVWMRDL